MSLPSSAPAPGQPGQPSAARARRRARVGGLTSSPAAAYDFRRPIQLSREHLRILQLAFDGFARQATTVFTSALRSVCSVALASIEQRSYAEYVDSLDATTYLTMFSVEPLPGTGLLEMPLGATMTCIDHMLGGPGSADQPLRPLTEIEGRVVRGFSDRLLGDLRYSLAEIVQLEPEVTGVEYSPQFAQAAGAADVMVVVTLDLRIDERPHRMTVCLPFSGLLPHLAAAAAPSAVSERERTQRDLAAGQLRRSFETVPVEVAVRLRGTRLQPRELASLQVGDVLRLTHPASAPLDVRVDDSVFAHATAGARGARLAALIVATPEEDR